MFEHVFEQVLAADWTTFQKARPQDVPGICMFIWDEMVHRNVTSFPFKIAPYTQNNFSGVAEFIQKELGRPPVTEAYAVSYFNEITPKTSFIDVSLVRCWPNDIHIADVEFSDNRLPVHAGPKIKGELGRSYHGLHIFGDFINGLRGVAKEKGVERISLMVADGALYPVFKKYGFEVSETYMAQIGFKKAGMGFPMVLQLK